MISTSHGLPHCRKLIMFESPPSMDYCTLCRSYNILNLHLQWPPMDFTHCWSLLHNWSLPPPISTSHGLTQSFHITLYIIISTSHGLSGCKKLLMFESPPPMDSFILSRRDICLILHLLYTPVECPERSIYWIYTSNDLLWSSPIVDHWYTIHHYLLQSPPPMDFHSFSI